MEPRKPLPRGPVTYAEEQMARLISAVTEGNKLMGQILEELRGSRQVAGAPAAVVEVIQGTAEVIAELVPETAGLEAAPDAIATQAATDQSTEAKVEAVAAAAAETSPDSQPPPAGEGEVKLDDGPGPAPAKRTGRR